MGRGAINASRRGSGDAHARAAPLNNSGEQTVAPYQSACRIQEHHVEGTVVENGGSKHLQRQLESRVSEDAAVIAALEPQNQEPVPPHSLRARRANRGGPTRRRYRLLSRP